MELSDGDDTCDDDVVHANQEKIGKDQPAPVTVSSISSTQMTPSQIITGNIVYNNQPHIYPTYYQNYQQMMPNQMSTGILNITWLCIPRRFIIPIYLIYC